jgi:hypothetical protein
MTLAFQSGPFNIEQGNSAAFTVEFLDSNGFTTVPSSASLAVAYTNTSNSSQTDNIALKPIMKFFIGTWSSTSAALGLATYTAIANSSVGSVAQGQIRVIQRKGSS